MAIITEAHKTAAASEKKKAVLSHQAKMTEKQESRRVSKTQKATLAMRGELWSEVSDAQLWLRTDPKKKGFTTIPRPMPLFMEIINDASKRVSTSGKSVPAGRAYLVLWCRVFDEGVVRIDSEATAALEAGYVGERNVSTWREHLRVLQELGFVDTKPGPGGPHQYILLFNPYHVARALKKAGWIQDLTYTALFQRGYEIGADDMAE